MKSKLAKMEQIYSQVMNDDRDVNPNQIYMLFGHRSTTRTYCFLTTTHFISETELIQKSKGSPFLR